jgi:hypothetical protein
MKRESIAHLKNDIEHMMKGDGLNEVVSRDFQGESHPPNFPPDIMDRLWDDYHEVREKHMAVAPSDESRQAGYIKETATQYSPKGTSIIFIIPF